MTDDGKTRAQLSDELQATRRRVVELEAALGRLADVEAPAKPAVDIAERRPAEDALRAEKNKLEAIIGALQAGLTIRDRDYTLTYHNDLVQDLYGNSVGKKCYRVFQGRDEICEDCPVEKSFEDGEPHSSERRVVTPDGEVVYFQNTSSVIRDARGEVIACLEVNVDVTPSKRAEEDRRKLEAHFQQTQKLESLGVLAGGIAHDFNNILTGLLGNADLALSDLPSQSPIRSLLHDILEAGERAAELTSQMLAYSGRSRLVVEDVDINALVQGMSSLLENSATKKVELSFDLSADLPTVSADATQLRQIFLSLVSNASEAVGDMGGWVRVRTYATDCDRAYFDVASIDAASADKGLVEGRYVIFEVADSGCGMDDETKAKIFEPFFTTKFTGRGLGLAAVQGIVRGHQGAIAVETELGKGTTFEVLLPAVQHPVVAVADGTGEGSA